MFLARQTRTATAPNKGHWPGKPAPPRHRIKDMRMTGSRGGRRVGPRTGLGAIAGLLAAATALGVGQFVAGLTGANGSPVVAVGQLQIDFTPPWLKNFAITEFGSDDKLVLVSGIVVVLAIFAAGIGQAGARGRPGAMGQPGAPGAPGGTGMPGRPGAMGRTGRLPARQRPEGLESEGPRRRSFLAASAATAGIAAGAGLAGRGLAERSNVANARKALRLPQASGLTPPLTTHANLDITSTSPVITC